MNPVRGDLYPSVVPGLLLALLSFWYGTLPGGATAGGSAVGFTAVMLLALIGAADWPDPLRLGGRLGRLLPLALVATAITSWYLSPVGRAGLVGVLLLPAFLMAPAGVARCWRQPEQLQIGLATISLVVASVAAWSLLQWLHLDSARAAMPLGHHNLLAGWLAFLLPMAAAGLNRTGARRWLAATALTMGVGAILATGSMLGMVVLALQGSLAALWWPAVRLPFATAAGLAALSQIPRGWRILTATDLSAEARFLYLRASWDGFVERPMVGWGPGSTPWLIARFLKPDPEVNPPSQVVGDFHSLPAQLAFELGLAGLLIAACLWILFIARGWSRDKRRRRSAAQLTALLGLAGGSVFLLGNAAISVLALPAAAITTSGALLTSRSEIGSGGVRPRLLFSLLYLLPVGALLLPMVLAQVHYDRAVAAETPTRALDEIGWARDLDPTFPLYGARKAWLQGTLQGIDDESARLALQAAEEAEGLAPFWLAAGFMGMEVSADWTLEALTKARNLDPLSPLPPFLMALFRPQHPEAPHWAATAVRLEPRLLQTAKLKDRENLTRRTIEALQASGDDADRFVQLGIEGASRAPGGGLGLTMDRTPAVAFSIHGFRRRPWPATLVRLPFRP